MTTCIRNGTLWAGRVPTWALVAALAACLAAPAVRADDGFATRVLFSYGAVETLHSGETDWEFARRGMALGPRDIVRMPPGSLLRLESVAGDRLDLLTGIGEGSPAELLAVAAASASAGPGVFAGSSEGDEVDVLPAGDLRETPVATPTDVTFDAATSAAWMADLSHEHETVRNVAGRVLGASSAGPYYMPQRIATAHALFAAMKAELAEPSAFASLFPDPSTAGAFAFAALLAAADIPARRYVDGEGRPFVFLDTGLTRGRIGSVTASRSLYRTRADGGVELPIRPSPGQTAFLQAWYAGESFGPAAD